jgi:hypothetical protein
MYSLEELAAVFSEGVGCGFFTIDEVILFADSVISNCDAVPYDFIELSLMRGAKVNDIEDKLCEFSKMGSNRNVVNMILGMIGEKLGAGQMELAKAIRCTVRLLVHSGLYTEDGYYDLYIAEDYYELALSGTYGNLDSVEKEFCAKLKEYSSYFAEFKKTYLRLLKCEFK